MWRPMHVVSRQGVDELTFAAIIRSYLYRLHIGQPSQAGHVLPEGALQRQHPYPDVPRLRLRPVCRGRRGACHPSGVLVGQVSSTEAIPI